VRKGAQIDPLQLRGTMLLDTFLPESSLLKCVFLGALRSPEKAMRLAPPLGKGSPFSDRTTPTFFDFQKSADCPAAASQALLLD